MASVVAPANAATQFPLCPIDKDTHVVLQAFSQLFGATPPSAATVGLCRPRRGHFNVAI